MFRDRGVSLFHGSVESGFRMRIMHHRIAASVDKNLDQLQTPWFDICSDCEMKHCVTIGRGGIHINAFVNQQLDHPGRRVILQRGW